jgi:ribosomal 50S subunit-recycling heat shock protein
MRLDKFLKVSRIIKRRSIANEACDAGKVMVNNKIAKAGLNLKVGDIIEIKFKDHTPKFKVMSLSHINNQKDKLYELL